MAGNRPSFGVLVFLIAVVIVAAGVGGALLYESQKPPAATVAPIVAVGDNVTVNYLGMFGTGTEQGKVFDTSIRAVADNNATYPKSLQYSPRNASAYTPLGVHVGARAPASGYTINGTSFGSVVAGFWQGLLGLSVGQTRWITIPPALGYGPLNHSCLRYVNLLQSLPSRVVYTPSEFAKSYPGVASAAGVTFADPSYGWTDTVQASNNSSVVVQFLPTVGQSTRAAGWPILVTAVTNGTVTFENLLTNQNAGSVLGKVTGGSVCGQSQFTVFSVNPNGTFTENFNREVVGQTLVFEVTVAAIVSH